MSGQFFKKFHAQTAYWGRIASRLKEDGEDSDSAQGEGSGQLARVLGLWDLTMLGVGTTLGVGVYVLAGAVAREDAGPAVVLSFLIAAVASALAGLCYAEFAARVPRAGSAYVYSYVTVGELAAFLIGWNIILEYIIGNASVARALSDLIDELTDRKMSETLARTLPMDIFWLSKYPDFLSFVLILLLSVLIAWGVRESSYLNNFFTTANLLTVAIVMISGAFYFDYNNWSVDKSDIPSKDPSDPKVDINGGVGGFFPFGFAGVMTGAAKCFYGFVGFDCVATMGEEAKNPKRDIPLAIVFCLLITCFTYLGIASTLTLMAPYYLQNIKAPLPFVFERVGLNSVKYIVSAGSMFAVTTGLLGGMFPMPRVLYAMSHDGLLFQCLKYIHPRTHTPVVATMVAGVFAGLMAAVFNLSQLMHMMSIGTLLAYTIVALCVLILRYRNHHHAIEEPSYEERFTVNISDIFNNKNLRTPTKCTEFIASWALTVFMVFTGGFCLMLNYLENYLLASAPWAITLVLILALLIIVNIFILWKQPQASTSSLSLKVPLVPFVPCVSIFINFYLMAKLDIPTWIRFTIWLVIGMLIYIFYSIPNSVAGKKARQAEALKAPHNNPLLETHCHQPPIALE